MRRKTFLRLKYIAIRGLVIFGVLGFLYVYFTTSLFRIETFSVSGISEEEQVDLKERLTLATQEPLMGFIPGDRVFSYYHPRLSRVVYDMFPYTESLRIKPSGFHELDVEIKLKTSLFATEDGKAIARDGSIYVDTRDISRLPVLYATTTPNERTLEELATFSSMISSTLWHVSMVRIDEYEDVYFYSDEHTGYLVAPLDASFTKLWSTLLSAVDTEPLKSSMMTKKSSFAYIDLRYGNKVFYKFTNGDAPDIIPQHEELLLQSTTTPQ